MSPLTVGCLALAKAMIQLALWGHVGEDFSANEFCIDPVGDGGKLVPSEQNHGFQEARLRRIPTQRNHGKAGRNPIPMTKCVCVANF